MKKVLIGFVFVLCLVGGVAIGKIRQKKPAMPLVTDASHSDAAASPESSPSEMAAADATPVDGAVASESPTEAMASEPPTDTAMASASDTGSSSMDSASASSTPEVASDATAVSGRSFGTGSSKKSRSSSGSSGSSGSSRSSSASSAIADSSFSSEPTPRKARASGTPVPDNQVIDVSTPPPDDFGTGSESSFDVPPETGTGKSKTPAIASSELDDLPTIDDGGGTSDPFASTASAAPTPDPFANTVAMASGGGGGGGELVFPSGSGRVLKKVTQKQNGASTVVRIEVSGSPKSRTYKTRQGKVMIDIEETDVPGGQSQTVAGSGQVREISAKPVTSAGGMKIARVQIMVNVTNDKLPNISTETTGNAITVTIGGAASEF